MAWSDGQSVPLITLSHAGAGSDQVKGNRIFCSGAAEKGCACDYANEDRVIIFPQRHPPLLAFLSR